jgi:large subunit ribosomal protein L18
MRPEKKRQLRLKRHRRLRCKVSGTAERPRLAVFKSLRHVYAQLIDDGTGATLACASTLDKSIRDERPRGHPTLDTFKDVADLLCERAKEKGIERVVFDHGGFGYKGRIRAFAERTREKGLVF